jgi:hypothetical protein
MRKRTKLILSCIVLAGGTFAAAGGANADSCQAGSYTVSTTGPSVDTSADQTSITYTVSGNSKADHIAAVFSSGSTNCQTPSIVSVTGSPLSGNQAYNPGVGDPITGLGKLSCHDEAVKVNPNGSVVNFTITVQGVRAAQPKSVVVKKGNGVNACEITGIGDPAPPEIVAPVTEIIKEPGSSCAVEFTKDQITGKLLKAELVDSPNPDCKLYQIDATSLNLEVDTPVGACTTPPCALGKAKFGEGYVHSGTHSCTTRFIGGRLYTWGDSCPE